MPAGYSGTPLIKKLGIKPGNSILLINRPDNYFDLLGPLPENITLVDGDDDEAIDFIHLFAKDSDALHLNLPTVKKKLAKNGTLWISWIKKSSEMQTDIIEADVRNLGLKLGLVDVKICAVDKDWSGLKFMYRKKDR